MQGVHTKKGVDPAWIHKDCHAPSHYNEPLSVKKCSMIKDNKIEITVHFEELLLIVLDYI